VSDEPPPMPDIFQGFAAPDAPDPAELARVNRPPPLASPMPSSVVGRPAPTLPENDDFPL